MSIPATTSIPPSRSPWVRPPAQQNKSTAAILGSGGDFRVMFVTSASQAEICATVICRHQQFLSSSKLSLGNAGPTQLRCLSNSNDRCYGHAMIFPFARPLSEKLNAPFLTRSSLDIQSLFSNRTLQVERRQEEHTGTAFM